MGAGDMGGLGVSNIRHAMNINDVVSDTVHQFAPTYHSYVLYSNSGARNAPKTVRPKEVFVLPEEPNKFHDNANLLANMELGVHRDDAHRVTMSDDQEGSARQSARDDDALYRANTFSDVDEEFRAGPLEEDEVCHFAAAVCWHMVALFGKQHETSSSIWICSCSCVHCRESVCHGFQRHLALSCSRQQRLWRS